MYNQSMNGYNIFYMGIRRNVTIFFRVSCHVFGELCNTLYTQYGYEGSKGVHLEEFVAIIFAVLRHGMGNRMLQDRFHFLVFK